METTDKLDQIKDTMTEVRVSIASLSGDVRASLSRHDAADRISSDFERRIRGLERRSYAVPGLASVLGVVAVIISAYGAMK